MSKLAPSGHMAYDGSVMGLEKTLAIIGESGDDGNQGYLLENFERLIAPFAETLEFFPVERLSVITGAEGEHRPISAIHPNAIEMEKNNLLGGIMSEVLRRQAEAQAASDEPEERGTPKA
jgi:hypothetical protein